MDSSASTGVSSEVSGTRLRSVPGKRLAVSPCVAASPPATDKYNLSHQRRQLAPGASFRSRSLGAFRASSSRVARRCGRSRRRGARPRSRSGRARNRRSRRSARRRDGGRGRAPSPAASPSLAQRPVSVSRAAVIVSAPAGGSRTKSSEARGSRSRFLVCSARRDRSISGEPSAAGAVTT